jgi:hypothetical protein
MGIALEEDHVLAGVVGGPEALLRVAELERHRLVHIAPWVDRLASLMASSAASAIHSSVAATAATGSPT